MKMNVRQFVDEREPEIILAVVAESQPDDGVPRLRPEAGTVQIGVW